MEVVHINFWYLWAWHIDLQITDRLKLEGTSVGHCYG